MKKQEQIDLLVYRVDDVVDSIAEIETSIDLLTKAIAKLIKLQPPSR
jgi:hypothetical protein